MTELSNILYAVTLLVSGLSCAGYLVYFFRQRKDVRQIARVLLLASGVLQTLFLLTRFVLVGHTPITSPFETIVFFAWSTTWAFLTFHWRYSLKNFGTIVSLMIFSLLIVSLFASQQVISLPPKLQSVWLPVHAGISIFSYGFLSLAFCGGVMYLILERALKRKQFGFLFERLPSLDALDQLNSHCITIGFGLFTVGILTGVLWLKQVYGDYWHGGPKEVWSTVIWFALLFQVHQRYSVGWRGRRAALLLVITFVVILLTLWGVTYLSGGAHGHAI